MVTQGKLRCIPTSPCFREAWSVAQTLKVHQLPAFCLLPCLLQLPGRLGRAQGNSPRQQLQSPALFQAHGEHGLPGHPPVSYSSPALSKTFLSFCNTGITKLHQLTGRRQGGKVGSPQQQGPVEAPGHVPGMGGHTQVQLLGTGAMLALGGISGFADACCWESISIVQRGGTEWVRQSGVSKSPSSPSTALHCFPVLWVEGQLEINQASLHCKLW